MAYCIRFFSTAKKPLDEEALRCALHESGSSARLDRGAIRTDRSLAGVGLFIRGDAEFRDEIARFIGLVEATEEDDDRATVLRLLRTADSLVVFQLAGGQDDEEAIDAVDHVVDWLFRNYGGLMQADGEGIFDGGEVVVDLSE